MNRTEKLHNVREALVNTIGNYSFIDALFTIFDELEDVGDSNISFSDGNLGINITQNAIDIVDIDAGKAIATITITV